VHLGYLQISALILVTTNVTFSLITVYAGFIITIAVILWFPRYL
jgi:hypothetical protein